MSVAPLAEKYLDEVLGLAISLWSIRSDEAVLDIEGGAGAAHGVGAVAGAVVRVNTRNGDAISGEESESTGGGFIGEKFSEVRQL